MLSHIATFELILSLQFCLCIFVSSTMLSNSLNFMVLKTLAHLILKKYIKRSATDKT